MHAPGELNDYIDTSRRSLFRLETLDHYWSGSDGSDYHRYIAGEPGPDPERKARWHQVLQADLDRGLTTRRVHVVRLPLSDYLRYECEWGYEPNLPYEDIRILDVTGRALPPELEGIGDYWLLDGERAAVLHYDAVGKLQGFTVAEDASRYIAATNGAWTAGVPFARWWDSHRQLRRGHRAA